MIKTRESSGADEQTPSLPQYFSWINNTNEGATEEHTLINLEYFKWLYDQFGMKIKIYALDAGNLDGASGTYEKPSGEKLIKQYPRGYAPIVKKAKEIGCHLGVWAGADGFGNTPEEEKDRFDLMVSLCRDHGFMLFKFDTVCGILRVEKQKIFKKMIDECRKYSPGLIVLNHRNDFGEAEICATTSLFEGRECYIDVHMSNTGTAMHNRAGALERGLVPGMNRLVEDHGVCISSLLDYFEDELILQTYGRALILAPEIYGNPWFLRDDEQEMMARIYNLYAKYADILVHGIELPDSYGQHAVSRGNDKIRFITLKNVSWTDIKINVHLGEEIGLSDHIMQYNKLNVMKYHPGESFLGCFSYDDDVCVTVPAFRSVLLAVFDSEIEEFKLADCEYEATPSPVYLGKMTDCSVPINAEQLYEASMFKVNNDSLESQSILRSGETDIPQVKAARDAFFAQNTYIYRGCEGKKIFDNDKNTYFDANTRYYGTRINGGCLRIDFGKMYNIKRIEIEYFKINSPVDEVYEQLLPKVGELSRDLAIWHEVSLIENITIEDCMAPIVKHNVHNIEYADGTREKAVYSLESTLPARYFRLPKPMDRIYCVKIFDEKGELTIETSNVNVNNMMSAYALMQVKSSKKLAVKIPETINIEDGDYIAVAINGVHGVESVYCAATLLNEAMGFTSRAASYPVNNWEHVVCQSDKNYTYYLKLSKENKGKEFIVYALFNKPDNELSVDCDVYFCKANRARKALKTVMDC